MYNQLEHIRSLELTLQGTSISHLGKRKIVDSRVPNGGGYVSSQQGILILNSPLKDSTND